MEPSPQQPPGPVAPPPPNQPARPKPRWGRTILLVLVGMVALLCLGGVGIGLMFYKEAAEPDRTAPDVAVSNYLRALLVERDDARVDVFACKNTSRLSPIQTLRHEIEQRERDFDVNVRVSWGTLTRAASGLGRETVETDITIAGFSNGQATSRRTERWRFEVMDDDGGWRVCGAAKLS